MEDDIIAVHAWARGMPLAGQKFDGAELQDMKDAGMVLSYHGTAAELLALSNNCNIQRKGPNAGFDAELSKTLRKAAEETGFEPIVIPIIDDPAEDAEEEPKSRRRHR